jgi:hypothetical protein
MKTLSCLSFLLLLFAPVAMVAQHLHTTIQPVEPQPLLAQALRLNEALSFLGSPLSAADSRRLKAMANQKADAHTAEQIQQILDPYCLAVVTINPEERVSVDRGAAQPILVQNGWTSFLVKVYNQAGITAPLQVQSPQGKPLLHGSANEQHPLPQHVITPGQAAGRFAETMIYRNRPLSPNLSGLALEYVVLQIYSKDKGRREIELGFHAGKGSQDIRFRNSIPLLCTIRPAVLVRLNVRDADGSPAMASFTITDGIERILPDTARNPGDVNYLYQLAENEYGVLSKQLKGIYPLPSRRLAATDSFPDFFFEPQIYRAHREYVQLPPGHYRVRFTRGPAYITQYQDLDVPAGIDSMEASFSLKRWIDLSSMGWYSGDHHVHAAGCSHYESPEEGVSPAAMFRQVQGEDLNVAALLSWGPGWYYQKQFFTGAVNPLSTRSHIIRYDVEVSGFPSSHAGHLDLLGLQEDDYPGTTKIEEWPSWTLPVLQWAKQQGAITAYAHSGWGLQPVQPVDSLPNYRMPAMDGIGANEYIVAVTENAVDLYSAGDTPAPWELNMWYHTLNCGFRPRLSGETDFPCIFDERIGMARSYFKPDNKLGYDSYLDALKKGRSYVSDGRAHIIDFTVNGLEMGTHNSELRLAAPGTLSISARIAAYLPAEQDEEGAGIAHRPLDEPPYWHLERARIGRTRKVPVELIVNGTVAGRTEITADGKIQPLHFTCTASRSCWVALRVLPSVHTNPVFVLVNGQPVAVRKSAAWCRQAVDRCWQMKQNGIRPSERSAAEAAYNQARRVYDALIREGE